MSQQKTKTKTNRLKDEQNDFEVSNFSVIIHEKKALHRKKDKKTKHSKSKCQNDPRECRCEEHQSEFNSESNYTDVANSCYTQNNSNGDCTSICLSETEIYNYHNDYKSECESKCDFEPKCESKKNTAQIKGLEISLYGFTGVNTAKINISGTEIGNKCLALDSGVLYDWTGVTWQITQLQPQIPYYFYAIHTSKLWHVKRLGHAACEYTCGDVFIDTMTCNLYMRTKYGWKLTCELKGDTGATGVGNLNIGTGITGPTGATSDIGVAGIRGTNFVLVEMYSGSTHFTANPTIPGDFIGEYKLNLDNGILGIWNGTIWDKLLVFRLLILCLMLTPYIAS